MAARISAEQYGGLCHLFEAAWRHVVPNTVAEALPVTSAEARALALLAVEVVGGVLEDPRDGLSAAERAEVEHALAEYAAQTGFRPRPIRSAEEIRRDLAAAGGEGPC